jgi:hypothetical protein
MFENCSVVELNCACPFGWGNICRRWSRGS